MGNPDALVVPYPVQGHVIPFMELSHHLLKRGVKITFVNTEFNHKRISATMLNGHTESEIHMVSVPDGLSIDERNDIRKLTEVMTFVLPGEVDAIIRNVSASDEDDITCLISDMGSLLDLGVKMGIKTASFWTTGAGSLAQMFSIPMLIDTGLINADGTLLKDQTFQLSPAMPLMESAHLIWLIGDQKTQKIAFSATVQNNQVVNMANWQLCNTSYELEPAAIEFVPNVIPIGPLLASNRLGHSLGHFWAEDWNCLKWLDQQPAKSVVYVAFGSLAIFDSVQLQEIALGLELANHPFLWVMRPDMTKGSADVYPEGFQARVSTKGQIVGWAPQQKVLSHPSIACFLSHCGWNSTLEGVANGVPFLCWSHFADQFQNQNQICNVWKVGLSLYKNEVGIVSKIEIKEKVNQLLCNVGIRTRISELQDTVKRSLSKGGSSATNFDRFVDEMKNL